MQGAYGNSPGQKSSRMRNYSVGNSQNGNMDDNEMILDKMQAFESKMKRAEILKNTKMRQMQQKAHSLTTRVDEKIFIR